MEKLQHVSNLALPPRRTHDLSRPILDVKNLTVRYGDTIALENITFRLNKGERVAVIGPNGAGKSTLFNAISGVLKPNNGHIDIYGHGPDDHICIAYVPQRSQVDWKFPVNVTDVVMMGRVGQLGLFRWPGKKDRRLTAEALALVGLSHLAHRQIGELSGGQQQRVFIARALAQEAALMLMDEPLTGLDVKSQEDILAILDRLQARDVTVMVATHDLNQAAEDFDRLMLLNRRLVGFGAADDVFTPTLLQQAYSGSMRLIETSNGTMFVSDTCCDGGEEHHHG